MYSATGPWGSGSYVYDALGNLRSRTEGAVTTAATIGVLNRVGTVTRTGQPNRVYTYDARGNAATVGAMSFTYDFANQPVAVSGAASAAYDYDANLKRVKEVRAGKTTYTVYSKLTGGLIYRDEATDGRKTDYVSAGGSALRLITGTGAGVEYVHGDHLGSPIAATDGVGAVAWQGRQA